MHDPRARSRRARPDPDRRPVRAPRRRARGGHHRGSCRRAASPSRVVATIGTTSSTVGGPDAEPSPDVASARLWLHVDAAYAGAVALLRATRAFAGWEHADFDRGQPAQVAVHARWTRSLLLTRRINSCRGRRSASCRVPAHARPRDARSTTTTSTRRSSAAGSAPSSCGCSCAGSGLTGSRGIATTSSWAAGSRSWVDADPDWERLDPPVRRSATPAARTARQDRRRRSTTPTPRSWTR